MADAFDVAWNISKSLSHEEQTDYENMMLNLENARVALADFSEDSYAEQLSVMMMELEERFASMQRPEDDSPAPPFYQGVAGFSRRHPSDKE